MPQTKLNGTAVPLGSSLQACRDYHFPDEVELVPHAPSSQTINAVTQYNLALQH